MNPKKLGQAHDLEREPWKAQCIEQRIEKRFGRQRPTIVMTVEERAKATAAKKAQREAVRAERRAHAVENEGSAPPPLRDATVVTPLVALRRSASTGDPL